MTPLRRPRLLREPPILLQILVLLLGGLVVAQLVTLLLTIVLPPAPPTETSLDEIVAALRADTGGSALVRTVQAAPPAVEGPGWFTAPDSRHALATRLGVTDEAVRLAFYAPLPFAGIAGPPLPPRAERVRPVAWAPSSEPLRALPARLIPASLILTDEPGGGFPGGGMPGGGFQGGGFPGGNRHGDGSFSRRDGGSGGQREQRDGGEARMGRDGGVRSGNPSPSDLDRQPIAAPDRGGGQGVRPDAAMALPHGAFAGYGRNGAIPTEGFDPRLFQATPSAAVAAPPIAPPAAEAQTARSTDPVERPHEVVEPRRAPLQQVTAPPRPAIAPDRDVVRGTAIEAAPLPLRPQPRALFGLAPSPFVAGDFVAAVRRADGRWVTVQPVAEPFPNAWQRRVMLWFAIAFALVAPIGWLFARHIVRPLARFTAAAERLGRDPAAALVALDGPAEIGRAAHAFNVMQNRLRSFVDDRTAMVGAISHDLRTPLTRMRFRIEEVEDDAIRDGMSGEVTEMEAMITSVLAFIRDASTANVRERLDLGLLVEDVAQDATLIGSDVRVEATAAAPVEVDVLGMRRLLANLVENAVKYGGRARIRLAVEEEAALAEILDDGPGVPEDELERAFEPFYRASNAEGSGKTGSGLGLAVCRSIARAHGGDVRLIRAEDGFRAQLRLPLAYGVERAAA